MLITKIIVKKLWRMPLFFPQFKNIHGSWRYSWETNRYTSAREWQLITGKKVNIHHAD